MTDVRDDLASHEEPGAPRVRPRLRTIPAFGSDPGNLGMKVYTPVGAAERRRPLVVVLHGCTQTAEGYDAASGWSRLADAHDFLVVYPEQRRANNERTCFSWFEPGDIRRGGGEVESIHQMVVAAVRDFGGDERRVFICGLSAGGAMAGAMLAAYPDVFRAGAIIAGLPYGTAANVSEAYDSMSTGRIKDAKAWGDLVRTAASGASLSGTSFKGTWPGVAIWHGTDDKVVKPINAGELVKQWTNVHGLGASVPAEDHIGRIMRRSWSDGWRQVRVIEYLVPGLGHGAPIDDRDPPAPFFLPAGISSTWHIAHDWGLTTRQTSRSFLSRFGL